MTISDTSSSSNRSPGNDRKRARIVSLSAVTWNFALVGRTRMLTEAWLRRGQPTTFVQVPSYRTALQRLAGPLRPDDGAPVVRPWPVCPSRWWQHLSEKRLRAMIRRRAAGLRRQLDGLIDFSTAVAVVVSPVWAPWLEALPFRHLIYDCIDDVAVHVPRPELTSLYQKWENELIERVSGAVVTARPLRDALRSHEPRLPIATIRNGVDVERFQRLARSAPRPADVRPGPRPVVGFVGALYEWIDWRLIAEVAAALPNCDFVFVGPHDGKAPPLQGPNVVFLGARPYDRVPAYVQAFDVCWVPFDRSRVSQTANPVKIYEYLALGKPVVATPVADTDSFEGHVRVGGNAVDIVAQLQAALAEGERGADQRVRFAQANSWDVRAEQYVAFVASLAG